jgi:hypothetical protein
MATDSIAADDRSLPSRVDGAPRTVAAGRNRQRWQLVGGRRGDRPGFGHHRCETISNSPTGALPCRLVSIPFVPDEGFDVPLGLETDRFRLEPLGPEHNKRDHEAWMSSIAHIRGTPGFPDGNWPSEMSAEQNLADPVRRAGDFAARTGFTYSGVSGFSNSAITSNSSDVPSATQPKQPGHVWPTPSTLWTQTLSARSSTLETRPRSPSPGGFAVSRRLLEGGDDQTDPDLGRTAGVTLAKEGRG